MRENTGIQDDIEILCAAAWVWIHEELGVPMETRLLVEVSGDRRRTMHKGGIYYGITEGVDWSNPGVLISLNCFRVSGGYHAEYPNIDTHPVIGDVWGHHSSVRSAVCHEVAHAFTEYHDMRGRVKYQEVQPFRDHSAEWIAVYWMLREQFVNWARDDG